jgi:uncharacterized protein (DUF433 family)
MTAAAIQPEPVPLTRDQAGRLMVAGTRVPIDVLVYAFREGRSPEAVHESFDTVALADIYSIFAYYLHHRAEVDAYLAQQEREDEEVRAQAEAEFPPEEGLRAKLLARLNQ